MSVRLRLTLIYAGFLVLAGALLIAAVWLDVPATVGVLAFLLVFVLLGGWILTGRVLGPLALITDAARTAANGSLPHRIRLQGRRDELRELSDAFDAMLARLEAHIAEQQRFAVSAAHELRTPLAITQALLGVAGNDLNRDSGELVERLLAVNARAIDLTEALLLLSRAEQRSFNREHVDLSLIAEEATETLFPLAAKRGVTIQTSGDITPAIGSRTLLLQMTTNLLHNAIVHNLPEHGTVQVKTVIRPESVALIVENTGEMLTPQLVSTLTEPFRRGPERICGDHAGAGLGLAIVKASPKHTTEPSPSPPGLPEGSASRCSYPQRHRTLTADDQAIAARPGAPSGRQHGLRDINTDPLSGRRTLAVRIGEERSRIVYTLFLLVPFILAMLLARDRPRAHHRPGQTGRLQIMFGLAFTIGLAISG